MKNKRGEMAVVPQGRQQSKTVEIGGDKCGVVKWPIIVDSPEGRMRVLWVHKKAVRVGTVDEIHIRLVLDRETVVLRCVAEAWVKERGTERLRGEISIAGQHYVSWRLAPPVMYAEDVNVEVNVPIAFKARELQSCSVSISPPEVAASAMQLEDPNCESPSGVPRGKVLLQGNLLLACFGYCHDDRTPEEILFLEQRQHTISKRAAIKKRLAGRKGGRSLRSGSKGDLEQAVKLARKLMRAPSRYCAQKACEQALRQFHVLRYKSGWRGLWHHVKKGHSPK